MRKKFVIALTVATIMGTMMPMAVYGGQIDSEEGETVNNPWGNLFEETSTGEGQTTKDNMTTTRNVSESATSSVSTGEGQTTKDNMTTTRNVPEFATSSVSTGEGQTTKDNMTTTRNVPESATSSVSVTGVSNGTIGKVKIVKKIKKKKTAKKIKISVKPLQTVNGYQVCVFKTKALAKKGKKALYTKMINKNVKTLKVSNKKLAKKKKMFVKVRAFKLVNGKNVFGPWSKIVKVKVK